MSNPKLDHLLTEAVANSASDIHLKVGVPPYMRIHGSLKPAGRDALSSSDIDGIVASLLEGNKARADDKAEIDVAHTVPGLARFRCNIFRQRGSLEVVMRVVPYSIPSLDELGLPIILKHIALESRGLVLVTGITGSGKSTTIASMVQHINQTLPVHIVTIEDPIEFVYRDDHASISQREVGIDTETFHTALKYVLRQDPDVIVLGEMRDRETAQTAMTAAETGHLVFSTLHTADAVQTIDRLVDLFPAEQHAQMRHQIASTLRASISMRLIARIDGKGLVPAIEVMMATPAIRSLIEENKLGEIKQLIAEGASQYGMQTFDQSILKLYQDKVISKESALEEASSPAELELAMRGITTGTMSTQSFIKSGESEFYKQKAREYFARAKRLFEQDLVEDALREVRGALVDQPDYEEAKALLAKIETQMKKETTKGEIEPYIKRGLEFVTKNQLDEAIKVFNEGLAIDPKSDKLLLMKKAAEEKKDRTKGLQPLLAAAQLHIDQGKLVDARKVLQEILEKEPGHGGALDKLSGVLQTQTRQMTQAEVEALAAKAEEAFGQKRWFDSIALWNLVREVQADHARAAKCVAEAGGQLKAMGMPGLPAPGQAPWAAGVKDAFEKGLTQFLGAQTINCLKEWKQAGAKAPQAADILATFSKKIEELHHGHVKYHLDRAKFLFGQGETGKAMAQLRHAVQVDQQSAEAKSQLETQRPAAEKSVQRYLAEGDQWGKMGRLQPAVFNWERAFEIDPGREGLKQKLADGRARLARMRDINITMDKKAG